MGPLRGAFEVMLVTGTPSDICLLLQAAPLLCQLKNITQGEKMC